MDVPDLGEYFQENCANTDNFKFIKFSTIFPLHYINTVIKGSLYDDNIGDALHKISKMAGPLWSNFILAWSKPFADSVLASPNAETLLLVLKKGQQWA